MIDLKTFFLGHTLKNPVIAASGTFGFAYEFERYFNPGELGGVALKALTAEPTAGNGTPRIAETASGVMNSVGLQNPGVRSFKAQTLPEIARYDTVLIANIAGKSEEEYAAVIEELNDTRIDMFELNISCPNVSHGGLAFGAGPAEALKVTSAAKRAAKKPLIVKLSPNVTDIADIARAVADGGADAISLINTLLGLKVDLKKRRPLLKNNTGGLSGPAVKPVALRMVREVCKAVDLPVIGMGGIMTGEDALEFILCGAAAVMVGTATLADPCACVRIVGEIGEYMEKNNIKSLGEIRGKLEEY